jgi:AcrR family transcriptional regulator
MAPQSADPEMHTSDVNWSGIRPHRSTTSGLPWFGQDIGGALTQSTLLYDRSCYLLVMSKGQSTREAIIDEALRQASRIGLETLSLAPLADRLNLSKSGLFAHFKSKEALQLEIFNEAVDRFKRQVAIKARADGSSETRLRALFDAYLTWIRGTDADGGCLFMTMTQEYDDRPGEIRDRLIESQLAWRALLAGLVREGMSDGSFGPDADPEQFVFEFTGAALAFQHSSKLMGDAKARQRALAALEHTLQSLK